MEGSLDWSYSDQAQYDATAKKGCDWSRAGTGTSEVPVSGPSAFFRFPQHQQPSTPARNIQDIPQYTFIFHDISHVTHRYLDRHPSALIW